MFFKKVEKREFYYAATHRQSQNLNIKFTRPDNNIFFYCLAINILSFFSSCFCLVSFKINYIKWTGQVDALICIVQQRKSEKKARLYICRYIILFCFGLETKMLIFWSLR